MRQRETPSFLLWLDGSLGSTLSTGTTRLQSAWSSMAVSLMVRSYSMCRWILAPQNKSTKILKYFVFMYSLYTASSPDIGHTLFFFLYFQVCEICKSIYRFSKGHGNCVFFKELINTFFVITPYSICDANRP